MANPTKTELTSQQQKFLVTRTMQQIRERGLTTPDEFHSSVNSREITDHVEEPKLWVMHTDYTARIYNGWGYNNRPLRASYLCGYEDGQDWAVRIPGTITTIEKAIDWLTPAIVKKARTKGLPVLRQGDIFFVPMRIKTSDLDALMGTRHKAYGLMEISEKGTRYVGDLRIAHPQHPEVKLSDKYKWRAVQQKQLEWGGFRTGGD